MEAALQSTTLEKTPYTFNFKGFGVNVKESLDEPSFVSNGHDNAASNGHFVK